MRIALIANSLPATGKNRGGVARVAGDLAEGLTRRGHQVTVWTFEPDTEPNRPYRVRILPGSRMGESRVGRVLREGYVGNLLSLFGDYADADVLLSLGDSLLLPLRRKPIVRVMLGSALREALATRSPVRFVAQMGIYPQELLSALTQKGSVGISENTRRDNPFVRHVIPMGTDLSAFRPEPESKTPDPSVLFVGTLGGRKRGRLLVDWFTAEVRPRFPRARLTVVGPSGPTYEGVNYRTGISNVALAELYREAWVYASPSVYEGFGLPYLEALASGTPVIATPNPGSREVLAEGRYGLLVEDEEFPARLVNLIEDEVVRERMAEAGLDRAEAYSLDRMLDAYEALLAQVAGVGITARARAGNPEG